MQQHSNVQSRQQPQASTSGCFHDLHETRRLSGRTPRSSRAGRRRQKQAHLVRAVAEAVESRPSTALQAENAWVERTLRALDRQRTPSRLAGLREECQRALEGQRMPTIRNEEYRFTDVSLLLKTVAEEARGRMDEAILQDHRLSEDSDAVRLVIVNGAISEHSSIGELPQGVYIGGIGDAPNEAAEHLGRESRHSGGPFAVLNGALAEEVVCIHVPTGVELERPIHIIYATTGSEAEEKVAVSSPRLLVTLQPRASCQIVEEFVAAGESGRYFSNAVAEFVLGEGSSLKHGYVEVESKQSWHMKASIVQQAEGSTYALTETQLGGMLTRHDLTINQGGPDTETIMRAFLLCGPTQLHDLHSKLRLDHPRGVANQLHKCIVSASSGRGVFDGNVHVKRNAQQTNAAQLSRNLLLSPKAMVNVKPNLQIVADDVKCSHGCAVSDLAEEQLFYFRTRGIDYATARQVLVYSFGSEVTQHFKHPLLIKRIQENVNATLRLASLS